MFQQFFKILFSGGTTAQTKPSLDDLLEQMDRHLDNFTTLVRPAPESKPRTPFNTDLPSEQMFMLNFTLPQKLKVVTKAGPLMINMQRSARMYDGKFKPTQSEASPEFLTELEAIAYAAGAKDIGYVKIPNNAIFQDKGLPHEYAIVFTVEMDKDPIETAPSFECQLEVMDGYKRMAIISNKVADFMRRQGFAAYPGTALGGLTDYVHLAELAGRDWLSWAVDLTGRRSTVAHQHYLHQYHQSADVGCSEQGK
jgi:hypothetical protein